MYLNPQRIDYIVSHLSYHWEERKEIADCFCFEKEENINHITYKNKIVFPLSADDEINPVTVKVLETDIPVLFSLKTEDKDLFKIDLSGNLIFTHDYIKSSFYFFSFIQELDTSQLDNLGRFSYSNSIQKRLNCITIPVVNYYFEIILQGIELFCNHHNFIFKRRRLFERFGFFLSHDVDRIAFYYWRVTAYKIKQLLGLAPLSYNRLLTFKLFLKGLLFLINPFPQKDPYWNFEEMIKFEKELGIHSTFYFLHNENRKTASNYKLGDKKIKTLIKTLKDSGFEVGLHGTISSATNRESMLQQVKSFVDELDYAPLGIRQHFLCFSNPLTFKLQEEAGLKYDTTLIFAEHEGFRNGYCYPFYPYDFENEKKMNILEIPLLFMESGALKYRNLSFDEIKQSVFNLIDEVKKFGGIFSMLWHNSNLNDYEYPYINQFYNKLLKEIIAMAPTSVTGEDL
jgi:hypothetical protein